MVAGAIAGMGEHLAMFPVDTIKTRMQALGHPGQQVSPFFTLILYTNHPSNPISYTFTPLPATCLTAKSAFSSSQAGRH